MRARARTSLPFLLLLFLLTFVDVSVYAEPPKVGTGLNITDGHFDYSSLISAVNVSEVKRHVVYFVSFGTRATGYPSNLRAAEYIYSRFIDYGLENVSYEEFPVVDCISYGANITILEDGTVIPIHPLVPNFVVPSTTLPEGITGELSYARSGTLGDFDGLDVDGSIVILDWNSEANWLNAARLGARAVIFLPPKPWEITYCLYASTRDTTGYPTIRGSGDKCLWDAPLNFPRFYVESSDQILVEIGKTVRLVSTQRWAETVGRNVIGFIEGKENPKGIIILSSYYDSYSVVPTVAPGAQETLGVSALLELAKYLNQEEHKPPITIMVVAYGGHHQALAGSISFANEYFFDLAGTLTPAPNMTKKDIGRRIWRQYNLDLSTGSNHVYFTYEGGNFLEHNVGKSVLGSGAFLGQENDFYKRVLDEYVEDLREQSGRNYNFTVTTGYYHNQHSRLTYHPYLMSSKQFNYDHEPTMYLGPAGWTLTTAYDPRPYYWEPFDTIERTNWENLQIQLESIYAVLLRSIYKYRYDEYLPTDIKRDPLFEPTFNYVKGSSQPWGKMNYYTWEWGGRQHWGMITGEVRTWVEELADWKRLDLGSLPNVLIFFKGCRPLDRRFVFTEDDGTFEIKGGILDDGYVSAMPSPPYQISAWIIDPVTGNPVFVPDQGVHRYPHRELRVSSQKPYHDIGYLTVFNASTLAILDLMYPDNLGMPQDVETGDYFNPSIDIYESGVLTPPESFGIYLEGAFFQRICILAFPPGKTIEFSAKAPFERYPFLLLLNGTKDTPLGRGYTSDGQVILTLPVLRYAESFYYLNEDRLRILSQFMDITKSDGYKYHKMAEEAVRDASDALQEGDFSRAWSLAIDGWVNGRRAYLSSRPTIEDTTSAVAFFSFLILPFVILLEKLLFDIKGLKKTASLLGIFIATMIALNFAHPGFRIAGSPVSIVVGFSVLILSAPILFIIIGEARAYMRRIRIREVGKHEVAVGRLDQTIHALSTGIENMRKRKFRTTLTTLSIVIMVSSVVGFTSLSAVTTSRSMQVHHLAPPYEGVYIRKHDWGEGAYELLQPMLDYLVGKYDPQALIIPRAWRYSLQPSIVGQVTGWGETIGFTVHYNGKRIVPKALLGLSPEENSITNLEVFIDGVFFQKSQTRVCIIGKGQAEELGIRPEELPVTVMVEGLPFSVIGIITKEFESIQDLNNEGVTPVKRDYSGGVENPWDVHLPVDEMLIMPYQDVISLGGSISSVALKFVDPKVAREAAEELYGTFPGFEVYSNIKGEVTLSRTGLSITIGGLETQLVPLFIVMLALFSMMLGSIYERKGEISIYASLGLSPLHVSALFLAETLVYAVIGAILGFFGAVVQVTLYQTITQAYIANYSSSTVGIALAFAILATILSTLYPAYISSKLVTPSLERAWKIPTGPIGDMWEIPLPFIAVSELEARSILAYIHELLVQHQIREAPILMVLNLQMGAGVIEGRSVLRVSTDCRLAPYQVGVTQNMEIVAIEVRKDRWEFRVLIRRTGGATKEWVRLNRDALNLLREQFLLWRTLSETEREKYHKVEFSEAA